MRFGRSDSEDSGQVAEYLRFGRGGPARRNDPFLRFGKRGDPFLRFGKRGDPFLRFGKRGDPFLRFGKRGDPFLRFGKRGDPFLRFGKSGSDYLVFGKRGDEQSEEPTPDREVRRDVILRFGRGDPFLRFGKGDPFLRFGKGDPFLRFGKGDPFLRFGKGDPFLRFGKGDPFLRFGKGDPFLRFGKGDPFLRFGKGDPFLRFGKGDPFLRFGKGDPFLRFGKKSTDETEDTSVSLLPMDVDGPENSESLRRKRDVSADDRNPTFSGATDMRFEQNSPEAYHEKDGVQTLASDKEDDLMKRGHYMRFGRASALAAYPGFDKRLVTLTSQAVENREIHHKEAKTGR
ncbi:hypothetical protein RRG08_054072 [Elysia crispata]|uniref:Uncharacterized protein n=1 Tax=Elysia crispata TaxID=231223 RepID=A0AAE1DDU2_9GAST|nr:hypothetical protein RRG08_054072 [Elysia crispata]